jgi:transcriptional regulator with XRE-family HTH domain
MELRERRVLLGWSRRDLATRARVDPNVLQLLELGMSEDEESRARCDSALTAGEQAAGTSGSGPREPH